MLPNKNNCYVNKQKDKQLSENSETLSLNIQKEWIDCVQAVNYLGIQIDNNLNWKGHIKA